MNSLESWIRSTVTSQAIGSAFIGDLRNDQISLLEVRDVFEQFYWWRLRFHQWFGHSIALAADLGDLPTARAVSALARHVDVEIAENHAASFREFVVGLGGKCAPLRRSPLPDSYLQSYFDRYGKTEGQLGFWRSVAGMAAREELASYRNVVLGSYLSRRGLDAPQWVSSHVELEGDHSLSFVVIINEAVVSEQIKAEEVFDAAAKEVSMHIEFLDSLLAEVRDLRTSKMT